MKGIKKLKTYEQCYLAKIQLEKKSFHSFQINGKNIALKRRLIVLIQNKKNQYLLNSEIVKP